MARRVLTSGASGGLVRGRPKFGLMVRRWPWTAEG